MNNLFNVYIPDILIFLYLFMIAAESRPSKSGEIIILSE